MAETENKLNKNGDTGTSKIAIHELEKIEAFQKAILENAGAMIIATDNKGIITLFNPEAVKKLGYSEDEILYKKTPLLFHDEKEIREKKQELIDEFGKKEFNGFDVLVEKARRNLYAEERFNYIKKSGETFPVWLSITQLVNGQKEPTGFLGIAFDISEKIKAEQKFKKNRVPVFTAIE